MNDKNRLTHDKGQLEIYTTDKGTEIEVKLEQETIG